MSLEIAWGIEHKRQKMKLISLNIEGHRHLHQRVLPFLVDQQPDVVCLQEVFGVDLPHLKHALQMDGIFVPMCDVNEVSIHQSEALGELGLAVLSKDPEASFDFEYYVKKPVEMGKNLPIFFDNQDPNSMHRALAWVTLQDQDGEDNPRQMTIATTHFTWSPKGSFTEEQAKDLVALLELTAKLPTHVLCGDFNSPRLADERNVFAQLAELYTDNIPLEYKTSLDADWHKAGKIELMVDGMFSSLVAQSIQNCTLVAGVSDHKAIMAEVI